MQSQQQAAPSHATSTQTTSQSTSSQTPSSQSATPPSNQDAARDAGLASDGPDSTDYSLTGQFAGMLLDALPIAEAVQTAWQYLCNPAVQSWLSALDPRIALGAVPTLAHTLMDNAWPVGVGLQGEGELAGRIIGGVGLKGSHDIARSSAETLSLALDVQAKIGLAGDGIPGFSVKDALGETEAALVAKMGIGAQVRDLARTNAPFGPADLLLADLSLLAEVWLATITGAAAPAPLIQAALPTITSALHDALNTAPWSHDVSVGLNMGGGAQVDSLPAAMANAGLGETLLAGLSTLGLERVGAAAKLGIQLLLHPRGPGEAMLELGISARAQLDGLMTGGGLLAALPAPAHAALGDLLDSSADASVQLKLPLRAADATQLDAALDAAHLTVTRGRAVGAADVSDRVSGPLVDIVAMLTTSAGDVGAALGAAAAIETSRAITLDLDPARLADAFPAWLAEAANAGVHPDVFAAQGRAWLEASATIGPAQLERVDAASLVCPPDAAPGHLVHDIAKGLFALRFGEPLTGWLAGQDAFLFAAAETVTLDAAVVHAELALGAGGSVSAPDVSATARAAGTVYREMPVDGDDAARLERAVAGA